MWLKIEALDFVTILEHCPKVEWPTNHTLRKNSSTRFFANWASPGVHLENCHFKPFSSLCSFWLMQMTPTLLSHLDKSQCPWGQGWKGRSLLEPVWVAELPVELLLFCSPSLDPASHSWSLFLSRTTAWRQWCPQTPPHTWLTSVALLVLIQSFSNFSIWWLWWP